MPLIEETLISLISTAINFSTIPVNPIKNPQTTAVPRITYQRIDSVPVRSLAGFSGLAATRFQFDCWSDSYSGAKTMSTNLRTLLQNYSNFPTVQAIFPQNESDKYIPPIAADDTGFYGSSLDFIVWHSES